MQPEIWVQANYRETQLRNIRPGDRAEIRVDAFPGVTLAGTVVEIAPASGSQFALLPPDNATGNFTKVTQRVPVKIVLDSNRETGRLRPGLSVIAIGPHRNSLPMTAAAGKACNRLNQRPRLQPRHRSLSKSIYRHTRRVPRGGDIDAEWQADQHRAS